MNLALPSAVSHALAAISATGGYAMAKDDLPEKSFATRADLRNWLEVHHASHHGLWVKIARASSSTQSISFEDLLDEGLCFGWSESMRRAGDDTYYLQKFTPRRSKGTVSPRNKAHVKKLIAAGRMTPAGLNALGMT